ncbi:MAG: hypothetical protein ACKOWF_08970 [Chloroflexota bacterium]
MISQPLSGGWLEAGIHYHPVESPEALLALAAALLDPAVPAAAAPVIDRAAWSIGALTGRLGLG